MIVDEYNRVCNTEGDINENLPILRDLAKDCMHITEMGVRGIVSTWAFMEGLKGRNGKLVSIDIVLPEYHGGDLDLVEDLAIKEDVDFSFIIGDTLEIPIEETDLLFIDTLHTYNQLKTELKLHADKAKKYIVLHDTVSCADELMPAVREFLSLNYGDWNVKKECLNNNGLLILERYEKK